MREDEGCKSLLVFSSISCKCIIINAEEVVTATVERIERLFRVEVKKNSLPFHIIFFIFKCALYSFYAKKLLFKKK